MTEITPNERVADATDANWVDRFAPRPWRPYLRLSRADRPIGTWLLLLPCWWGIPLAVAARGDGWRSYDLWLMLACGLGAFLMRGAGCTWNDFTDRHFDAQVARTKSRPLPSGQVTPRQALIWMCVQALIAFAILMTFPLPAILVGVVSLAPVAVYPFAKRFTWWPQVFLGIAFNWGVLVGFAAIDGGLGLGALLLYLSGISWTLFYDTIYAHQDTDDDALIGVKSTARLFGDDSPGWLWRFLLLTLVLNAASVVLVLGSVASVAVTTIALAGTAGLGLHLFWQLKRLDIHDPGLCLALFRSNRDAGLIVAVAYSFAAFVAA